MSYHRGTTLAMGQTAADGLPLLHAVSYGERKSGVAALPRVVVYGGIGLAAFLLYRALRKKTAPSSATPSPTVSS